jgi:GTP-binding protein Era
MENDNIDRLISVTKKYIPEGVKYFSDDEVTNLSKQFMISEYVREKLFKYLKQEVPHSITCVTSNYEEKENIVNVNVDIIVDRDSLKGIVIGKDGSLLKTVGQESRKDIEELLGKQVYLELYVKTVENWREKERTLREFGILESE